MNLQKFRNVKIGNRNLKNRTNLRDNFRKILKRKQDYWLPENKRPATKKLNLKTIASTKLLEWAKNRQIIQTESKLKNEKRKP